MAEFLLSAFADEAGNELQTQIEALQRNGIYYIEPRNANGSSVSFQSDEELIAMRRALDAAGIRVSSLGSPIGKYKIHEPFAPHEEDFRRALHAAKLLGTTRMRMFSFFVKQDELAECRDEVLFRLRKMVKIAEEEGILLCHENESRIYGQMPEQVADLLAQVPGLRGIFDAANYRMNNADPVRGIDVTLPKLEYLHIKDAIFSTQTIVPAGEGEGRVGEAILKVDAAYDGPVFLSVEPHLKSFIGYAQMDEHELKGNYHFETSAQAFDFACTALKNLLRSLNFTENDRHEWVRASN